MDIIPAIDIIDGKVVRLLQGQFDKVSEYSHDPLSVAKQWIDKGAKLLHVVDLDGARDGKLCNFDLIASIAQSVDVPVQTGGGIRTEQDIKKYIDAGLSRVIVGTKIIDDKNFLKSILAHWHDKIAIALDCSNGMVAQRGWVETTNIKAVDFAKELEEAGVECLIYTDIKKDGTLAGPNIEGLKEVLDAVKISVIASGGVSNIEDIKNLCSLNAPHLVGAITGRAIYEETLNFEEALDLCSQKG